MRVLQPLIPLSCMVLGWALPAWATDPVGLQASASEQPAGAATSSYEVPDVNFNTQSGAAVSLRSEIDDGRPVVLNFVFTSCEAICPMMTQTFAEFQRLLGADAAHVHLMSISIDPEQDTPSHLRAYARKFHAARGWSFYTGTQEASIAAQKAFNLYRGDKMAHAAVTFMRAAPGEPWRRLDGFESPEDLMREFKTLVASR